MAKMRTLGERLLKHGPENVTPATKKVPSGIKKMESPLKAQASSHAAMNAYNGLSWLTELL